MKQFHESVAEHFRFLESIGFVCAEKLPSYIRYESDKMFLSVSYDNSRSYEIGCAIGKRVADVTQVAAAYSIEEIFRSLRVPDNELPMGWSVHGADQYDVLLERLSTLLQKYARELLKGDEKYLFQLSQQRTQNCEEYSRRRDLSKAMWEVEHATRQNNYAKIVQLLDPFLPHLSLAEKALLDYAKKRIAH